MDTKEIIIHVNKWYWGTHYTLATAGGKAIMGFGIEKNHPYEAYFSSISVVEECRRLGLGKKLHMYAEKMCKEMGVKTIILDADTTSDIINWFKRIGFKEKGINTTNQKTLIMIKTFNSIENG